MGGPVPAMRPVPPASSGRASDPAWWSKGATWVEGTAEWLPRTRRRWPNEGPGRRRRAGSQGGQAPLGAASNDPEMCVCAKCCSQLQGSSKVENRDSAHEEFTAKDPRKVQKHNLGVVFRLTWVGFSSVQLLSHVRLFATPWSGQALHKTTVWSPSEPQPTAFRVHFFPVGGLLTQQAHNPSALRVPGSCGDSAAPEKTRGAGAPGACVPAVASRQHLGHVGTWGRAPPRQTAPPAHRRGSPGMGGRPAPQGHRGHSGPQPPELSPVNTDTRMWVHTQAGAPHPRSRALWDPCPPKPSSPGPPPPLVNDTPSWELRGMTGVSRGLCSSCSCPPIGEAGVPPGVQGGRGDGGPQRLFLPPRCRQRSLSLEREALSPAPSEITCGGREPLRSGTRLVLPEPCVLGKTTNSLWTPVPVTADAEGQEPAGDHAVLPKPRPSVSEAAVS